MNINLRIIELRKEKKISQRQLAIKSGLSQSYYNEIEKGKSKCPIDTLEKICKALQISLSEFFADEKLYKNTEYTVLKSNDINDELRDIGVEYIAIAKKAKDKGVNPDVLRKIVDALD